MCNFQGALVAQLVKPPTLAQVMISQLVGLNPAQGSALTVQSLLGILSLPLSLPLPCLCSLSFSLYQINFKNKTMCDLLTVGPVSILLGMGQIFYIFAYFCKWNFSFPITPTTRVLWVCAKISDLYRIILQLAMSLNFFN